MTRLIKRRRRIEGVLAELRRDDGAVHLVRIDAEHVFLCAGPMGTPALLLRSGIPYHVGHTLRIHPYLKVVARYPEAVRATGSVTPLLQIKELWPALSLGGAYGSPGQIGMTVSEDLPRNQHLLDEPERLAIYYVGVRATGRGWIRPSLFGSDAALAHYELSEIDCRHLGVGLARLAEVLLASGAEAVYPSVWGLGPICTELPAGQIVFPRASWISQIAADKPEFAIVDKLDPIYLRQTQFVKAPAPRLLE